MYRGRKIAKGIISVRHESCIMSIDVWDLSFLRLETSDEETCHRRERGKTSGWKPPDDINTGNRTRHGFRFQNRRITQCIRKT